jgi:hypothetical protein
LWLINDFCAISIFSPVQIKINQVTEFQNIHLFLCPIARLRTTITSKTLVIEKHEKFGRRQRLQIIKGLIIKSIIMKGHLLKLNFQKP